jgi:hypothetical protein
MPLPGFNAESSVYKPKGRYYTASIPNGASGISSGVRLALYAGSFPHLQDVRMRQGRQQLQRNSADQHASAGRNACGIT